MAAPTQTFRFLDLPPELRDAIYANALEPTFHVHEEENRSWREYDLALLRVSKSVREEARDVFKIHNVFCCITGPWPEMHRHISVAGHVPLVAADKGAKSFNYHHLSIEISGPIVPSPASYPPSRVVILLQDLPKFTDMWFLSDISHGRLNTVLSLTLRLQNPYTPFDEDSILPKSLQQQLLLPFGCVKELHELKIEGRHYQSVEKALRDAMAVPTRTAEDCLEEATQRKDEGNALLQQGKYREAIQAYESSFASIFIFCKGRKRDIWGEAHFHRDLTFGTYKGQHGHTVTMMFRIRLVANVCQAYLKLEEYEEVRFWGMRSIKMIRIGMMGLDAEEEEDEVYPGFPAAAELGKIYYRTGIACRELGDRSEARKLLRVAEQYLPRDLQVKKELATVALRIG